MWKGGGSEGEEGESVCDYDTAHAANHYLGGGLTEKKRPIKVACLKARDGEVTVDRPVVVTIVTCTEQELATFLPFSYAYEKCAPFVPAPRPSHTALKSSATLSCINETPD
jgi:hypothetical protein